jgi:hypothetical protein
VSAEGLVITPVLPRYTRFFGRDHGGGTWSTLGPVVGLLITTVLPHLAQTIGRDHENRVGLVSL